MLDHVSLRVADYDRSKKFYAAALAPLGYALAMESASGAGFRKEFIPDFWVKQGEPVSVEAQVVPLEPAGCGGPAVHVAFAGDDRATVDAFYRAALAAGARDNGAPEGDARRREAELRSQPWHLARNLPRTAPVRTISPTHESLCDVSFPSPWRASRWQPSPQRRRRSSPRPRRWCSRSRAREPR
jgi:catechol 2,3-dioxygenase-like lactoylglutathione lyase family enzyme